MADQITFNPLRAFDSNGDPVSGALAYFYETGTTTPVTAYTTSALSTPHDTPLEADANGVFAQAFFTPGTLIKTDVKDPDTLASLPGYPVDPTPAASVSDSSAASVTITPFTGISSTNVQAALEEIYAEISTQGTNPHTIVQTGGSSNAYTLTAADTITSYAIGQRFVIRANHTSSGAATLNVDGLGAKAIQYYNPSNALTDIGASDILAGEIHEVAYDGTRFVLVTRANVIDEDAMTSNTPTKAPSQQSVKAYADAISATIVGVGQTWADMSGSRVKNTSYQNTTGRTIQISVTYDGGTGSALQVSTDNSSWVNVVNSMTINTNQRLFATGINIPAGHYYRISDAGTGTVGTWAESR